MNRFKQAWLALLGLDYEQLVNDLYQRSNDYAMELSEVDQLKRDLELARAAIADLKSKLPLDWEAQQKAASDAIGNAAIADMRANPSKYIK